MRDGDDYIINGSKMFITNAGHASWLVVFASTDKSKGHRGLSAFVVPTDAPGVVVEKHLDKMGQRATDTSAIAFQDVVVPVENRLGEEGQGFKIIMHNFNSERMGMAASCTAYARVCVEEAIAYARERKTFGKPISQHQVIRHKLVDMAQKVAASQAMLEMLAWRLGQGESPVAEICMMTLKP